MYRNHRIIAIIPARSGSKGVHNKNIRIVNRVPLIAHTIQSAKGSSYIDRIVVSTDSKRIQNIALSFGADVPFLRPKKLADDNSKTIDSILYTIDKLRDDSNDIFDSIILLQPTSPLITSSDINGAIESFYHFDEDLASISKVEINPFLIRTLDDSNRVSPIINATSTIRRQDLPSFYKINGAIYVNKISKLKPTTSLNDNPYGFVIDESRSLDIDSYEDIKKARRILKR
ncbi:MAG: acylneuraminate cytidylyltransferase family protein [Acholeplasma sp.]|nr:acylneuraminate cytidylyltransferase family protein [Acholeplasma sp.]